MIRRLLILLLAFAAATPVVARAPVPQAAAPALADPALTARAGELVAAIAGTRDYQSYFSPTFRADIAKDKWDSVVASLTAQLGKPIAIDSITPVTPFAAYLRIRFERGIASAQLGIDTAPPYQVNHLTFTGSELAGDSLEKLATDVAALPGKSELGIYTLGTGEPRLIAGSNPDRPAPIGSAFKLWVLGELARSVAAGERKWSDVVAVGPPSLPSGMTQAWPPASPVTLHTLATLMISISDNTATDTLVVIEGTRLDAFAAKAGAPGLAPIPTTRQMFAMKAPPNAALAAQWLAADPAARRKLLDANAARLAATPIDIAMFSGKPVAAETLEWFASPAQTAAMLDRLRTQGDGTALALLGINAGVDPATRARFDYVGFKGGSEPGVISLNFLVRRKDGRWLAIAAAWHRSDDVVDTLAFTNLLTRALTLAAAAKLPG